MKSRLWGLGMIALGLFIGWFAVWQPLQEARQGAPEISYYLTAFILVPFLILFGGGVAVGGQGLLFQDAERRKFTIVGWVVIGIAVILAGLGFWWFQQQFAALGYT